MEGVEERVRPAGSGVRRADPVPPVRAAAARRWTVPRPPVLVAAGLWVLLAVAVLANSAGHVAVDTKPELYFAPWRSAAAYLSAWQENPQLGFPSFNVGLVPVAVLVGLVRAVGVSPELSMRVLRLLLLTAGAWGAARLYRALRPAPERDPAGPLVAGTAFVANPYVVVAGGTQAVLLPWALLPWQLLVLVYALRDDTRGWRAWRRPAAFSLVFFAMTGMNAGVIPLLQLAAVPVVVLVLRHTDAVPWRRALAVLARCAAGVLAVSAYWLVPSVLALGAGSVVVDNSETLEGISGPSSYAEVLRGLGQWPLYGSGPTGPWLPEYGAYLRNPLVVLLTFGLPVLAGLAAVAVRGRVRRLGLGLVALAAPVMVGVFPPSAPSPFGAALREAFEQVPAAGAFRTTNKIGALLVLGVSLLVAAGAAAALRRTRDRPGARAALVAGLVAVLAAGTVPAWTGRLYTSTVDLPGYWTRAAADLEKGPRDERVWFVPGEVLASYRWSQTRPDDLSTSVLSRPSLVRTVIPATSPAAANLLAAADVALNEGGLPPGALSAVSRYLGVGDVLLRNDVVWEDSAGGRPQVMQDQVNADPGLLPRGNYGAPGENTTSSRYPPASAFEAALPPLQRYAVAGARPVTRTEAAAGTVLVDGDGFAVAPLVAAGLLGGEPAFRYLGDLSAADVGRLLAGDAGRVVLTDTNRRRATVAGRLGDSQGPLLPVTSDPGPTRALFGPAAQTVLRVEGGSAAATEVGSAFGTVASGSAENAVDGDPATAWRFGDFQRAAGQALTVRLDSERSLPSVTVRVTRTTGVRISRLRITVGAVSRDVDVDAGGVAAVTLDPPVRADAVRVEVLATGGEGFNLVGIDEVETPGVRLARVARLPETLSRLAAGLDDAGRAALERTPVDVVLSRVRGTGLPGDDEEVGLARDLTLPVARDYRVYGLVRAGALSERDLDALAGATSAVVATSTSRAFDLPTVRASRAVDGRRDTAWVPGSPVVGQRLTVSGPRRTVDHVDVTQLGAGGRRPADWVTRVAISVDGRPPLVRALRPGTTRLPLAPVAGSTLTLTLLDTRSGSPTADVRLSEVDFGAARVSFDPTRARAACVPVATVDGRDLRMRPLAPVTGTGPSVWAGCAALPMEAGEHRVRPLPGWTADQLVLRDPLGERAAAARGPDFQVTPGRGPRTTVRVSGSDAPYYLVTGQAYDPRWRATLDGRDLGPPLTVDGYSAGWRVDAPGSHTITIEYAPQRVTDAALATSGVAVLGLLALALAGARPAPAGPGPVLPGRAVRAARRRWTTVAGWLGAVAAGWLFFGPPLAAVAAVVAVWHAVRRPAPRTVMLAGVGALGAVPLAWLAFRPELTGPLTARIVQDDPWPHRLAAAGLLLLLIGTVRAERATGPGTGDA